MAYFPYTPFPFNVTPASSPFDLSPIASNISQGWVPSCSTPDCMPSASWSTGSISATLAFHFWGWDVTFDGNVKGNMSIELLRNGAKEMWNPSEDTLFSLHGQSIDDLYAQNITLKVIDASPGAKLTLKQARVNGSSYVDDIWEWDRWIIPSNDTRLNYTGFAQQPSSAQAGLQTTYISSKAGDTVFTQFNGSTFLIYGPCGPTNGLIKVEIDSKASTVNTSKPIPSDDCLIFQAWGLPSPNLHELRIENVDGAALAINRIEFFWSHGYRRGAGKLSGATLIIVIVVVVLFVATLVVSVIYLTTSKHGKKIGSMLKKLFS
ncbi:hypothetical protein RSOLAG22IIIB_10275 [Rhizoctonia solani]|uniref:Uncharacterized protein n=1 Tax=Rhizoctonia solani TaxID=456999 RepID=A0A0K6G2Y6_9AGAM|nr:hypothetical protein RSOLAG22IIIB_10275 [Rhizoctonia solani]